MSDAIFYCIELKKDVLWSRSKMDAQYRHACDYMFRDRAKYKEVTQKRFNQWKSTSNKKFIEIEE